MVDNFFKGNKNLIKKDMLKKILLQKSKRIQVLQLHLIKIKTMIVPVVLLLNLWTFISHISIRSTRMRVSFRCGGDKKSKFYYYIMRIFSSSWMIFTTCILELIMLFKLRQKVLHWIYIQTFNIKVCKCKNEGKIMTYDELEH